MVRGTVNGQFVIAACQGVAGAASIYLAGFHSGFFIFAIVLTALSIIPLGGGVVTIPFGIGDDNRCQGLIARGRKAG